jgi:hypothetical protein
MPLDALYQNGDVSIDQHFARFGSKSFAINKINSVEVRTHVKSGTIGWLFFWLFGLLSFIAGVKESNGAGIVLGLILGALGYLSFRGHRETRIHRLYLMTSSSEAQAFETTSSDEVSALRSAIERAIAGFHA